MSPDSVNNMIDELAKRMANDIDREVLWGMLKEIGWTRVMLTNPESNEQSIDIMCWLEEHCKHAYERNGRDFIFEDKKDAVNFILAWV